MINAVCVVVACHAKISPSSVNVNTNLLLTQQPLLIVTQVFTRDSRNCYSAS